MTLHVAGQYQASNTILDQAEDEVERLYTRRVRSETKAFLTNDSKLPYEGEPYEQTMINVIKALNYAAMGNWTEAVVEARRIDHRLNVLTDRTSAKEGYRDDAFARYLSGLLYEVSGDLNNAFISYRKAYELYGAVRSWTHVALPPMLRADLLRMTEALHMTQEHEEYKQQFPDVIWRPYQETKELGQIVLVSHMGGAPHKEDRMIDVPVSLDALNLVLISNALGNQYRGNNPEQRAAESVLYGLNGHVVRVAIPALVSQKTQVAYGQMTLTGPGGSYTAKTQLMQNLTAVAERALSDRVAGIAAKAVARAAVKYTMAEGIGRGAHAAAGKDTGPLIGLIVGSLAKAWAVASEEADKRTWRTLPDEIQIAKLWVPPGEYEFRTQYSRRDTGHMAPNLVKTLTIRSGETKLFSERVVP
ncbi:COG3014 family protein [Nitrospira sp. Nam74]